MTAKRTSRRKITRRQFIQLSAAGAAAGVLAGCQPAQKTPPPAAGTAIPAPPTPRPAKTVKAADDIHSPDSPSRVVHTSGAGVWEGDALSPAVLRRMLDTSITGLTGLSDARAAWASLFTSADRIAIKVNAFRNSLIWTHVPLVTAVTDSLIDAGVPAEQITLTDYYTDELETAGFSVNRDGPGVLCYGADSDYKKSLTVGNKQVKLNPAIDGCTALINMPVLKSHMITGITFAMKNHYGSINFPEAMHYPAWDMMAALNALPEIKDRTRLIIGDILEANLVYSNGYPYWKADYRGDSILMGFDPVAHDKVGLDILGKLLADKGVDRIANGDAAIQCLESAAALGLGTNLPEFIERVETSV
jgi:hypothetical protein